MIARDHLQPTGSLKGFYVVRCENASLLDAPLGPGDALDNAVEVKCSDLRTAITRLTSIAAHDALILLRSSLSAPRHRGSVGSGPRAHGRTQRDT